MASPRFRIGGESSFVDLRDEAKYLGFRLLGRPVPNRDKKYRAAGCGSPGTATAVLLSDKVSYWTRTYEVMCTGTSHADAKANALAIKAQTEAARKKEYSVWVTRHIYDDDPEIWTVLTGLVIPANEEMYGFSPLATDDGQPQYLVSVEFDYYEGWSTVDGEGYPIETP
jgi:hypothetical protein